MFREISLKALLVAMWPLLPFAVFRWSLEGILEEKYCLERRACLLHKSLF
jgi:hypothetical protein